jgi:hypothetical protein
MRMTANDNTVARTLHDLGLAAWFGGSLMGATGLKTVPRRWSTGKGAAAPSSRR